MSVSKVFSCDLCTVSITAGRGRGLMIDREKARFVTLDLTEKHFCSTCINRLTALLTPTPVEQEMGRLVAEEAAVDSPVVCRA